MHPWRKIIRGKTEEIMTKRCFICLERVPCVDDDDREIKLHLFNAHSVKDHMEEVLEMCTEAEKKEEREGWSLDDILEETRPGVDRDKPKVWYWVTT